MAIKLNKPNAILSKLRHVLDIKTLKSKIIQFLNSIYVMPLLFGLKTITQIKDFSYYRKMPAELCS